MIQGSDEWKIAKLGIPGSSRVVEICKSAKGSYLASRKNYLAEKVCEILTGTWEENFTSVPMIRGTETEPFARSAYEAIKGVMVEEHPGMVGELANFWSSPDGLVGDDGGLEIKCPNTATHIETLMGAPIDRNYIYQMQGGMLVFKRQWWDFVSFDDRLPDFLQLHVRRVMRDETIIAEITQEVNLFNAELAAMVDRLKGLRSN